MNNIDKEVNLLFLTLVEVSFTEVEKKGRFTSLSSTDSTDKYLYMNNIEVLIFTNKWVWTTQ